MVNKIAMDNTYKIKKSALVSAIFKNEKMMKDIIDALKTSPGSSKRESVSNVLKTLNKSINNNIGGKGGGADLLNQPTNSLFPTPAPTPGSSADILANSVSTFPAIFNPAPININKLSTQSGAAAPDVRGTGIVSTGKADEVGVVKPGYTPVPSTSITTTPTSDNKLNVAEIKSFGNEYLDQVWNNLTPEQKVQFKPAFDAVESQIGPSMFSTKMMSDKELMKKLLPGVPEEALPAGASLARNVNQLEDTLKDEYKIDQLAKNVETWAMRGIDLEPTLRDYIAGRDQYVEKINGLIDDTLNKMATLDMSDNRVAQPMNQYMNYLYVIKGRQQKRYADMLKMGIDYNNNEYKKAQMIYDSTYDKFESEFKSKASVAEEDFNRYDKMFQDMYNSLDTMMDKDIARYEKAIKITELQNQMAEDSVARGLGFKSVNEMKTAQANFTTYLTAELGRLPTDDEFTQRWNELPENAKLSFKVGTMDTTLLKALGDDEEEQNRIAGYVDVVASGATSKSDYVSGSTKPGNLDFTLDYSLDRVPEEDKARVEEILNYLDAIAYKILIKDPQYWNDKEGKPILSQDEQFYEAIIQNLVKKKNANLGRVRRTLGQNALWFDKGYATGDEKGWYSNQK